VLCGSAFKNKGVQPLLDAVVDYPAVAGRRSVHQGHRRQDRQRDHPPAERQEPLALLAFKIMDDPFVGTITFCRIYSGTLISGHWRGQLDPRQAKSASAACC
jgi:elongation factor G